MNSRKVCKQKGFRRFCPAFLLILSGLFCVDRMEEVETKSDAEGYAYQRREMVARQIEARGVRDPLVLRAMNAVPRHIFVPKRYRSESYRDGPLPIGHSQTISQPYIVALMTELMGLKGGERVLEIGTGSGYQAAVLARIAGEVYSIEIVQPLCRRAETLLSPKSYPNIFLRCGDGYRGWPEKAPFDAIMVTAAPPAIPRPLIKQLKIGGRLIIPVGDYTQELIVLTRKPKGIEKKRVIGVRFVPMTGEAQKNIDGL